MAQMAAGTASTSPTFFSSSFEEGRKRKQRKWTDRKKESRNKRAILFSFMHCFLLLPCPLSVFGESRWRRLEEEMRLTKLKYKECWDFYTLYVQILPSCFLFLSTTFSFFSSFRSLFMPSPQNFRLFTKQSSISRKITPTLAQSW